MKMIFIFILLFTFTNGIAQNSFEKALKKLPVYPYKEIKAAGGDWLLNNTNAITRILKSSNGKEIIITNGLICRQFRVQPYMTCFGFKNLIAGKEMLRSIEPEAEIKINGKSYFRKTKYI